MMALPSIAMFCVMLNARATTAGSEQKTVMREGEQEKRAKKGKKKGKNGKMEKWKTV